MKTENHCHIETRLHQLSTPGPLTTYVLHTKNAHSVSVEITPAVKDGRNAAALGDARDQILLCGSASPRPCSSCPKGCQTRKPLAGKSSKPGRLKKSASFLDTWMKLRTCIHTIPHGSTSKYIDQAPTLQVTGLMILRIHSWTLSAQWGHGSHLDLSCVRRTLCGGGRSSRCEAVGEA